ncbi:MAG: hypothetical protein GY814_09480 [Gammaproteobacteria bacterium]|nr:hypothetical protein [Gammaproteobacteria bacterium]
MVPSASGHSGALRAQGAAHRVRNSLHHVGSLTRVVSLECEPRAGRCPTAAPETELLAPPAAQTEVQRVVTSLVLRKGRLVSTLRVAGIPLPAEVYRPPVPRDLRILLSAIPLSLATERLRHHPSVALPVVEAFG